MIKSLLTFGLAILALTAVAQTNNPGSVTLGWTASTNGAYPLSALSGYNLWYGTNGVLQSFTFVTNPGTLSVTGKVDNLVRGIPYTFSVKALGTNGLASEYSSSVSTNSPAPPPIPITLTVITVQ